MTPTPQKEVLLVDDHAVVREGLAQLIGQCRDLKVCGKAGDAREALKALEACRPDIAVVDMSLPGADGLDLIREVRARRPSLPILVLSMHPEELYAERALQAGAQGYITKHEAAETVLGAIRRVLAGYFYLSDTMQMRLLHRAAGTPVDSYHGEGDAAAQ
jgi:DNA-binding NarL/FixJ family response regulator